LLDHKQGYHSFSKMLASLDCFSKTCATSARCLLQHLVCRVD
jgi:hypothetical protein